MASRWLTSKQTSAVARALGRRGKKLPTSGCVTIRKTGKSKGFGVLPHGVSAEICRVGDRVMVTTHGPKRRRKSGLSGPKEFVVRWGMSGKSVKRFYTRHHAEQFVRAMRANGTPAELVQP